jgi:hypothetical protein
MIGPTATAEHVVTTSEAHVRAVARRIGVEPVEAGPYLYTVRKLPLFRQPIVYAARILPVPGGAVAHA